MKATRWGPKEKPHFLTTLDGKYEERKKHVSALSLILHLQNAIVTKYVLEQFLRDDQENNGKMGEV